MNLWETDKTRRTILHHAAKHGVKEVFEYLVHHPGMGIADEDINAKDVDGNTCLHVAIAHSKLGLVKYLLAAFKDIIQLNEKNAQSLTPFLLAVKAGCCETLQMLIDQGKATPRPLFPCLSLSCLADVSKGGTEHILDSKDSQGKGFLHFAVESNREEAECLAYLLEAVDKERIKAKLNERDNNNDTAFNVAAKRGNLAAMLFLLSKKKETDTTSILGIRMIPILRPDMA